MSGDSKELRNAALIIPPFWQWISVLAVTNVASSQDLSLLGPTAADAGTAGPTLSDILGPTQAPPGGLLNRYVRFKAVGATVGLIFAPTQGLVTGANVPVLAGTGSQSSANAGNTSGLCYQLLADDKEDWWISVNTRWLGFIGSGNAQLIITPSSRGGQG